MSMLRGPHCTSGLATMKNSDSGPISAAPQFTALP
jgi:hypothetical protein